MLQVQDIVVLSLCAFFGNLGVEFSGFGMAIIYFFVYQIASLSGFKVDFKYALFIQALSLFSAQPIFLYKSGLKENTSRKILLYFLPVTLISTPIGQIVGERISPNIIEVIVGLLICFASIFELYSRKEMIIKWLKCVSKRKDQQPLQRPSILSTALGLTEHNHRTSSTFHLQYSLGNKIGEGAFSTVRAAEHHGSEESFAVKIIHKAKLEHDELNRLQSEIDILRELHECKNVVHLYDFYEENNHFFLVTKMMEGGDLLERLTYVSSFNERQARRIFSSILDAVNFIHSKNIVHRDLKLENILCDSFEDNNLDVKLADFGFAKKETTPNTFTTMCGTPSYIAPEIIESQPYGKKVDVWSLGVIAFNLLSGYQPFQGQYDLEIQDAIVDCDFQFDEEYWKDISNEAKYFIDSLLTLDPTKRPSSKDASFDPWFSKNLKNMKISVEENKSKVFFMIGSQRSGSNWLRTMLDEREDLAGPHPPHMMRDILPILDKFGDLSIEENMGVLIDHVCAFVEYNQVPWTDNQGKKVYFPRKETLAAAQASCARIIKNRSERSDSSENCALEGSMYLLSIFDAVMNFYAKVKRKPMWICKSMGMSMFHKELMEFYGEERLRYIYLVRDPRDVAMSFMNTPVGDCHHYAIISKWTKLQQKAIHIMDTCPDLVYRLHYESILANKWAIIKDLYQFIGERRFGGVKRQASVFFMRDDDYLIDGAKSGMEAELARELSVQFKNLGRGQSFVVNQFAKWRSPLSGLKDEEIQIIESVAYEVMHELGYETHLVGKTTECTSFTEEDIKNFAELNKKAIIEMNERLKEENPEDFARRVRQSSILAMEPKIIKRTSIMTSPHDNYISESMIHMEPTVLNKKNLSIDGRGSIRCGVVTQCGYYPGTRENPNQDAGSMCPINDGALMFFSVYDGHGPDGHKCSQYANDKIPSVFANSLGSCSDLRLALEQAYSLTHRQLTRDPSIDETLSGTTATVALLQANKLLVANVGDSTCILGSNLPDGEMSSRRLCTEHTAMRADERERIIKAGGKVMTLDQRDGLVPFHENWDGEDEIPRVWSSNHDKVPGCVFTRSLGDSIAHSLGVSSRPEIFEYSLNSDDRVLLVVSDGITQFLDLPSCIEIVTRYSDPADAGKALVKEASDRWISRSDYRDDITAIVIFLDIPDKLPTSENFDIENGLHWEEIKPKPVMLGTVERTRFGASTRFWTLFAGFVSGFLGGLCGILSPPLTLYFLYPPYPVVLSKEKLRATSACINVTSAGMRALFYLISWRKFEKDDLSWFLLIYIVSSIFGALIGLKPLSLIKDSMAVIQGVLTIFLVLCGISIITTGILELV